MENNKPKIKFEILKDDVTVKKKKISGYKR
jgi:hypothetical protein